MSSQRIILKFGGKSLATVEEIHKVKQIILEYTKKQCEIVVVVSAMGSTTDTLIHLAHQVAAVPDKRELDMLLSVGERISMTLLTMALLDAGADAVSFTGSQSTILTTNEFTDAKIVDIRPQRILEALSQKKIVVIAGFQGVSLEKEVTTLGRGGSDLTAVALAAALEVDRVIFYKDVEGLYDKNPHLHEGATLIERLNYVEAMQILKEERRPLIHLRALEWAEAHRVPLHIQSFQKNVGTIISF